MHPSQLNRFFWTHLRASASTLTATMLLWLALGISTRVNDLTYKRLTWVLGIGIALVAEMNRRTADEHGQLSRGIQEASQQAELAFYAQSIQPQVTGLLEPSSGLSANVFNWNLLRERRDDYAHLLLLAKTGGGKSSLAEYLCGLLGGLVIAVAPHWEQGDYATANLILGAGRLYGTSAERYEVNQDSKGREKVKGEPEIEFQTILAGRAKPTVCQFIRSLTTEMHRRYQLDPTTSKRIGGPLVNVILDEFNAYAGLPGVSDCLKLLIREARKVGIRIVLLCQGAEVEALGIAGEGSLRESLTYIRIKQFAIDHAKVVRNRVKDDEQLGQLWTNLMSRMMQQERPCMVEDEYAEIPDLSQLRESRFVQQLPMSNSSQVTEVTSYPSYPQVTPELPEASNACNHCTVSVTADDDQLPQWSDDELWERWEVAQAELKLGNSRSRIIKEVWGYKGKYYGKGCDLWNMVETRYGSLTTDS